MTNGQAKTYIALLFQEVDHDGVVTSLRYDEFGDSMDTCNNLRGSSEFEDEELKNINIKAEKDDPEFR